MLRNLTFLIFKYMESIDILKVKVNVLKMY